MQRYFLRIVHFRQIGKFSDIVKTIKCYQIFVKCRARMLFTTLQKSGNLTTPNIHQNLKIYEVVLVEGSAKSKILWDLNSGKDFFGNLCLLYPLEESDRLLFLLHTFHDLVKMNSDLISAMFLTFITAVCIFEVIVNLFSQKLIVCQTN